MNADDLRKLLRDQCELCGSQALWSSRNGVSPGYLSDVLNGRREPGPALLSALGVRKIVTYERAL